MTNAPLGWRFVQVQARVWYACTVCSYKNVQKDRVIIIIFLLAFFRGTWAWFAWFIFHCFCSNSVNFYRIKIKFNVLWEPLKNAKQWWHFCNSAMATLSVAGVFRYARIFFLSLNAYNSKLCKYKLTINMSILPPKACISVYIWQGTLAYITLQYKSTTAFRFTFTFNKYAHSDTC